MWDFLSLTRDPTHTSCIGRWGLTTGPSGKSQGTPAKELFFFYLIPVAPYRHLWWPHFTAPITLFIGEGNGTLLQYYCLENPMDGEAWWAAVHGVAKSRTWLSDFTFTFTFMRWTRKWQPTPVFLPVESQGWGSLVGCSLWGRTESDTTEVT